MDRDSTRQGVLFKGLSKKAVVACFDQERASSDGGAVLLKACDERLGLSAAMAACLQDDRQQAKVAHSYEEIFQQRLFGIACGYADGPETEVQLCIVHQIRNLLRRGLEKAKSAHGRSEACIPYKITWRSGFTPPSRSSPNSSADPHPCLSTQQHDTQAAVAAPCRQSAQ